MFAKCWLYLVLWQSLKHCSRNTWHISNSLTCTKQLIGVGQLLKYPTVIYLR